MKRPFDLAIILAGWIIALSQPAFSKIVWQRSVEPWSYFRSNQINVETSPLYLENGKIYAVSSRGRYLVLDAGSGKRLVKARLKYRASSGLLVDEGMVYFGAQSGEMVCLKAETGEVIWTYPLKVIDISPPAVFGDLVIFQTGINEIIALNKFSGQWAWTYNHSAADDISIMGISGPVVDKEYVYLGTSDGYLLALRADDGRVLWKKLIFSHGKFRDIDASMPQDETTIYVCDFYGEISAVSKKTGEKYWSYEVGGAVGLFLQGEVLYISSRDGMLHALDKTTGLKIWESELVSVENPSLRVKLLKPEVYKNWIIVPNQQGKIFLLNPESGNLEKTLYPLKRISVPVLIGGDWMYLYANKGIIYKIRD